MSIDIVIATRNRGKLAEIANCLSDLPFNILSLNDFPNMPEIVESSKTFSENAIAKAKLTAEFTGKLSLADDSGIEIDHLDGNPGALSARFAGENASDEDRNKKVLQLLDGVPEEKRTARFVCVIAICSPNGKVKTFEGICEGKIAHEPRGTNGFGYDPIFIVPKYGKTFAELPSEVKNEISHRAIALKKAKQFLAQINQVDP